MAYTNEEAAAVWWKCDGRCTYGRKQFLRKDYGNTWQIHLADPKGKDELTNRLMACVKHNGLKKSKTREELQKWLDANPAEKACS